MSSVVPFRQPSRQRKKAFQKRLRANSFDAFFAVAYREHSNLSLLFMLPRS